MSRKLSRYQNDLQDWYARGRRAALDWKDREDWMFLSSSGPSEWAYDAGHREGVRERTEMEKRRREVLGCPCDGKKANK